MYRVKEIHYAFPYIYIYMLDPYNKVGWVERKQRAQLLLYCNYYNK